MSIRAEMLGTARVVLADGTVRPLKPTTRDHALVYLALTGDWVTRDRLGFLFWADNSDSTARHNVRQLLKRIRQLEWIEGFESDDAAVKWSVATDVGDLRGDVTAEAWDLLPPSGDLLPGLERNSTVEFEEWLLDERRHIRAVWQTGVVAAARHAAAQGDPGRGSELLEPLLVSDDRVDALPMYMELATEAGQRDLAVAAYERVSTRLRNDLGMEPPARAREMAQRLASEADAPSADLLRREFVGRVGELNDIAGLLALPECRLLTVFGPGGIGKSTIAQMVLDQMKGRYIDGGSLVSLESVRDPGDVPAAIASGLAISLDASADPVDQLIAVLRERRMLLVLDNAEHLGPAWVVFSQLVDACPNLEMVITSRERLRLEREWVYEISGLPDDDGVALFLDMGRRVAPEVTVSAAEAQAICLAVGGSPLGLELAVPWLRVMTPDEIVSEIRRDVEVLSGGYRDGLVRHQSVTATMVHSWQLASDRQRHAVEALSVFAAPYTRELAEQVGGATSVVLRDLVDQSLVHRRPDGRYSSHPLVRGYAAARLAEEGQRQAEVRGRHAATMLELAGTDAVPSAHQAILDDVIVAWAYIVESDAIDLIAPKVEHVTALMLTGGRINRGLQLLADASAVLERTTSESATITATIRYAESRLLYFQGHHADAARTAQEALRIATETQDSVLRVKASLALGWAQKWIAGDQAQYRAISPALPLAEELGDPNLIAEVLNGLGCSASTLERCRDHLQRGLDVVDSGSSDLRSRLHYNLGMVSWALGDPDTGIDHVRTAFEVAKSVDDHNGIVESLSSLAFIHADLGDLTIALQLSDEAESMTGASEFLKTRMYVRLIAGEVRRLGGDRNGAQTRVLDALTMATAVDNEPLALRALRLHGQLLIDQGNIEHGLGVLSFVLAQTANKGGDFTSQIINPKAWEEATRDIDNERIEKARTWAEARGLDDLIAAPFALPRRDVDQQRT